MTDPLSARGAYNHLAPVYDTFTADYDYETWLDRLSRVARARGLEGTRALDVACGTGKSFVPLLRRGFDVVACDLSPAMAAAARRRRGMDPARVFAADMRSLPECGRFDLITCLDDAVNYLLTPGDLLAALRSIGRLLDPDGVFVFDANTLHAYRSAFAAHVVFERDGLAFTWDGGTPADAGPGTYAAARVTVRSAEREFTVTHHQRHHSVALVRELLDAAGLRLELALGQSTGCVMHDQPDELHHTKTVFVARRG